jgi:hypothetical protein
MLAFAIEAGLMNIAFFIEGYWRLNTGDRRGKVPEFLYGRRPMGLPLDVLHAQQWRTDGNNWMYLHEPEFVPAMETDDLLHRINNKRTRTIGIFSYKGELRVLVDNLVTAMVNN